MDRGRWRAQGLRASPALVLVTVSIAELVPGPGPVLGLVVVAPLLAALVHGPRPTAWYGLAAFAVAVLLGLSAGSYSSGVPVATQVFRLSFITLGGIVAVAAAQERVRREAALGRMTKVADAAQRAILANVPDRVGPALVCVHYESAASDALIGGDLYAVVQTGFGLRAVVGDVRGKGLGAVGMSAQVLATFRERAGESAGLDTLLDHLDRSVSRTAVDDEEYVTAVVVQLADDGTLQVAVAGHPPPVVLSGGRTRVLDAGDVRPPLGLGGRGTPLRLRLDPGDRVLLHTDGLTEARDPVTRRFLSAQAIAGALAVGRTAQDVVATLRAEAVEWTGGSLGDDLALVVLEYAPR